MDLRSILLAVIAVAVVSAAFDIHAILRRTATRRHEQEPAPTTPVLSGSERSSRKATWDYLIATAKWHPEQMRFNIRLNGALDEALSAFPTHDNVMVHILSHLGSRGWELVAVVPDTFNPDELWALVFKQHRP